MKGTYHNFPKIDLISYYVEQIPKFGSLGVSVGQVSRGVL